MSHIVTDQRNASGQAVIAWIATVVTLGYMLPWAVAATRGKSNAAAVGLLNFFLGWSVVGWFAALIMACSAHQVVGVSGPPMYQQLPPGYPPPGYGPAPQLQPPAQAPYMQPPPQRQVPPPAQPSPEPTLHLDPEERQV